MSQYKEKKKLSTDLHNICFRIQNLKDFINIDSLSIKYKFHAFFLLATKKIYVLVGFFSVCRKQRKRYNRYRLGWQTIVQIYVDTPSLNFHCLGVNIHKKKCKKTNKQNKQLIMILWNKWIFMEVIWHLIWDCLVHQLLDIIRSCDRYVINDFFMIRNCNYYKK